LIDHLCIPIYEAVARDFIAFGKIKALGFSTRPESYLEHVWIPPGWHFVDPVKEAKGKETELQNNMDTLTDIAAAQGKDVDEVLETRARELKKMKDLEEKYGIQFPKNQGGKSNPNGFGGNEEEEEERILEIVK